MHIVDAQVHIWAASTPERPWPARHAPHKPVPFSKYDLLREMDAAGVYRAIIVPPAWEGERNDLGLAAAQQHPDRFAVMGRFDTDAPDMRGMVMRWRQQPGMLGLRLTFKTQKNPIEWIWEEAQASGTPIMVGPNKQLQVVDRAAERYPGVKIVIDHMAIPRGTKDDASFEHIDELLTLARRPNIAIKATGLPSYTTEGYPFRPVHEPLRRVYDAFGPKRVFWGTDLTKLPCTYRQAVTMFDPALV